MNRYIIKMGGKIMTRYLLHALCILEELLDIFFNLIQD